MHIEYVRSTPPESRLHTYVSGAGKVKRQKAVSPISGAAQSLKAIQRLLGYPLSYPVLCYSGGDVERGRG